jgi:hypothetical protein
LTPRVFWTCLLVQELKISTTLISSIAFLLNFSLIIPCSIVASPFIFLVLIIISGTLERIVIFEGLLAVLNTS